LFDDTGNGNRFFMPKSQTMIRMKKKSQSGKVPVSKLQTFLSELSGMLSQEGSEFFVNRSDDGTTSIRLARGQYLTISMQKGGQS
jgi:hypothetical protein